MQSSVFYKYRGVLIGPPLVLALVWPGGDATKDWILWPVGLVIFFIGLLGRIWAQQHLHLRIKIPVTLTTTGPYALVRNPIYICNTLICLGLTVLSGQLWIVPVTLVWCVVLYILVVRDEEVHIRQYGDASAEYYRTVSRWMPHYRGTPLVFTNEFLAASIWAEAHNFLFLLPFIVKKLAYKFM